MISIRSNESRAKASNTPTSSAEKVVAKDDLLTEILIRLPVKPFVRFKSVSKNWNSLISSPHVVHLRNPDHSSVSGLFVHACNYSLISWNERSEQHNLGLEFIPLKNGKNPTQEPGDDAYIRSLTSFPNLPRVIILNSCHGLLLCFGYNNVDGKHGHHVLNPTTKKFKKLPQPRLNRLDGLCLAYDPSESPHYEVVDLFRSDSSSWRESYFHVEIYSSQTGSWRPSAGNSYTLDLVNFPETGFCGGVYWNGGVHWLGTGGADSLYFNVDQERLGTIPMPPAPHGMFWYTKDTTYYGQSGGHLHLVELYNHTTRFTVYELERDYSGWFVKYNVDIAAVGIAFPEMTRMPSTGHIGCRVLDIVRRESGEESYMVIADAREFDVYGFKYCSGIWSDMTGTIRETIEDVGFQTTLVEDETDKKSTYVCRIQIKGMTCTSCSTTAEYSLQAISGVQKAHVAMATEEAEIQYDPNEALLISTGEDRSKYRNKNPCVNSNFLGG